VADDPGFARVDLLRRLGLVESALEELEEVVQQASGDTVRLCGFSSAYVRDERYHMALRIFRRHFAALATGDPALPRAFWEMLYPFGWRSEVTAAAQRVGLDPFLVAAVVREESSYYPRALSRAGARGLMQLMPATARPMAEHRGLAFAGGELLDDPGANIEIGTAFLAGLLREFKDPRLALAAYNAGPGRMRQWWQARQTSDVDLRGADSLRRDPAVRQACDVLVGGVPAALRWRRGEREPERADGDDRLVAVLAVRAGDRPEAMGDEAGGGRVATVEPHGQPTLARRLER
jgi:hypothetical protein